VTNAAAVIGLTFDSTDIQQHPIGIFLEIPGGIFAVGPSVRGTDVIVPGLIGRIARNRIADTWRIPLVGYVSGVGSGETAIRSSFAALRATMQTLFDPTMDPAALVATLEDGSTATIQGRPLPLPLWDLIVPSMARVSYELEAVEDWEVSGS
jgi:hypothetical protein